MIDYPVDQTENLFTEALDPVDVGGLFIIEN